MFSVHILYILPISKHFFHRILAIFGDIILILFKVDQLTGMMRENVLKIQARGEKIEDLQVLSDDLEKNASIFQTNAGKLKKKKMWENNKMKIIIGVAAALGLILLIIVIICSV